MPPKRVLLAYLNTGGGHRSAALAVAEALKASYGAAVDALAVDVTARHFRWPLSDLNAAYEHLVGWKGQPWGLTYHLLNTTGRIRFLEPLWWHLTRAPILELVADTKPDAVVCCHPLLKAPLAKTLRRRGDSASLVTLVTDLASGHAAWFHPVEGHCLVPTEEARGDALRCGLAQDSVVVTGLPVGSAFVQAAGLSRAEARRRVGLLPDKPAVVVIAGADGMGPFQALLRPLLEKGSTAQIVAITGRNERLRNRLRAIAWPRRLHVTGFVENMHEWMAAADVLVTKAGPGTIAEALVVGVPMMLCGAVPGQEPPNVRYAVESGAAVWAPDPTRAAQTAHRLLWDERDTLREMRRRAASAGRPDAARSVAAFIWEAVRGSGDRSFDESGDRDWADR